MNGPNTPSGASAFDFFSGHWQVAHRRLKQRLANSSDWEEFGGTCNVQHCWAGWAMWTTT